MVRDSKLIFQNKRIIIFGCGYIGSAFAVHALKAGANITALTHNKIQAQKLKELGIETILAELGDDSWYDKITGPFDFALNCVGSSSHDVEGYRRSYLEGMRSILTWSKRCTIGTFVYTSSTSVYSQNDGGLVDESACTDGISDQAKILIDTENLLSSVFYTGSNIKRNFILRLAGIYGPQRHYLLDQIRSGVITNASNNFLNLVHQEDIVAAIEACFNASEEIESGIYNCSDNNPSTKSEVIEWLSELLKIRLPVLTTNMASHKRLGSLNRRISSQKLINRLDWRPIYPSYQHGYKAIIETV